MGSGRCACKYVIYFYKYTFLAIVTWEGGGVPVYILFLSVNMLFLSYWSFIYLLCSLYIHKNIIYVYITYIYLLFCYSIIIYCIIIKSVSPLMPHFLFPCPTPLLFLLPEGFLRWLYHLRVFSLISLQYCHTAHVISLNKLPYLLIWSPILLNNCCALPYFIHRPFYLWSVV